MQFRFAFAIAAACAFSTTLLTPAAAQSPTYPPPVGRQGPDGTYASLSDYVSDVRGRPCGLECTRENQARWEAYYRAHPKARPY